MAANIYTSLEGSPGAIRLLHILPGSGSDKLECRLVEANLGPDLSYTALSYVWKNQVEDGLGASTPALRDRETVICCDGKFMKIGSNLDSALRRLRDKDTIVQLWADMLCIDQEDVTERNHQVGMMREIYEGSKEVVIWLGERIESRKEDSKVWDSGFGDGFEGRFPDRSLRVEASAFALIRRLAKGMLLIVKGVFQHNDWATTRAAEELRDMMDLPWWRRIWVVQETVVSPKATVSYGDMSLPWSTFVQAAANFASEMTSYGFEKSGINLLRDPLSNFSRTVLQIEKTRLEWMSSQPATPLSLLRKFRSRESSDKRDKVFALLGLVKTWERVGPLLPDYALSIEEVLWRTTVKIVASTQSLSVLEGTLQCRAKFFKDERSDLDSRWLKQLANLKLEREISTGPRPSSGRRPLPSWVVDWTVAPLPSESERLSHLELFNASAGLCGSIQLHGTSMMEVQGFIVDEIAHFGTELPSSGFARMRAMIFKWLSVAFGQKDAAAIQEKLVDGWIPEGSSLEAFSQAVCGGIVYGATRRPGIGQTSGNFRRAITRDLAAFREWSSVDLNQNRRTSIIDGTWQSWTDVEANQKVNTIYFAIETSSSGRSFFVSKHGYMGVGPATIQQGDLICIALGSRIPLIIRPKAQAASCQNKKFRVLVRNPDGSKGPKECSECHHRRYTIVGDAYVHGLMDGEIVKAAQMDSKLPDSIYLV